MCIGDIIATEQPAHTPPDPVSQSLTCQFHGLRVRREGTPGLVFVYLYLTLFLFLTLDLTLFPNAQHDGTLALLFTRGDGYALHAFADSVGWVAGDNRLF